MADFLRAMVEVVPRDQRKDLVPSWRATVLENIARFDVIVGLDAPPTTNLPKKRLNPSSASTSAPS